MVASLLCGQFAWRPLYDGQLSRGQFAAVTCPCLLTSVFSDPSTLNSVAKTILALLQVLALSTTPAV